ncbi:MAG: hypothetical protein IBX62_00575 [Coriobacteriia bacterium]|nr:hypothetical protein [Coriobacteriia bacterium]
MKRTLMAGFLAVVLVAGLVTTATAAPQSFSGNLVGGKWQAGPGDVVVTAAVNPKVELTLSEDLVDAGALDPDIPAPQWTLAVNVDTAANVPCDLTKSVVTDMDGIATPLFESDLAALIADIRGVNNYTDNYAISVGYDTDPGNYSATVTYTLVQR